MKGIMTQNEPAWTERQFQSALRKAGYKSEGQGCWQHKTGMKFYCYTWVQIALIDGEHVPVYGEQWKAWAAVRQTPPPF
jgi:hypothetical protein